MQKRKNKQTAFEKRFIKGIKEVKNPIRNSLIVATIWIIACIVFAVATYYISGYSLIHHFDIAFALMIAIAIVWVMGRLGVLEGPRLRFINWRNHKLVSELELKKDVKLTLEEQREITKKKSWVGIICLATVGLIGIITTLSIIL